MSLSPRCALVALALLACAARESRAQGGPPMITDDPGTPGNGHVEINLAWTDQRTPGSTLLGLPLLDANYGVGDRIQLNYQASWNILDEAGSPGQSGLSDTQLAVKWRFYDAGESGLQVSTFPRVTFVNPGSDSDRRGTADPNSSFLLPFELRRDLGVISVNVDLGHSFSSSAQNRGWIGGLCLGHQLTKPWENDLEAHFNGSDGLQRGEVVLNAGSRVDLSDHATLLLAVGRDIHDTLGPRMSLLTFIGIQLRK
jgi:hypothetical protein